MWNEERVQGNHRAAYASGAYTAVPLHRARRRGRRFSTAKALLLGAVATAEILVLGAMLLNIDLLGLDFIAALMITVLLYFGVVSMLAD